MKTNRQAQTETREDLLPPGPLRIRWCELLDAKRNESDASKRELQFQFAHGWLKALEDMGILSYATLPELRELLIEAKPD